MDSYQLVRALAGMFLLIQAIMDKRKMKVSLILSVVAGVLGIIIRIIYSESLIGIFFSVLVGVLFVSLSVVTRQGIGLGDGIVLTAVGFLLGLRACLIISMFGCIYACIYAVVLLVIKKKEYNFSFAFVPFITLGYTTLMCLEKCP